MSELRIEEYSAGIQQYRYFPQNSRRRRRGRFFLRPESRFGMLWLKYNGGLIKKSNRDVVGSDTLTARAGQEI